MKTIIKKINAEIGKIWSKISFKLFGKQNIFRP